MNLRETKSFTVRITGDRTGELYPGEFSAYRRLTHRQELLRDKINRELLGNNPTGASERAISQAEILAELQVSVVDAPTWWKECNGGLDLADDNVIQTLYKHVMEIKLEAINEVKKKAEEATKDLKEFVETPTK
jgi:hypothetical protein